MDPVLQPGAAFKLGPDGKWKVAELPEEVAATATFSGTLNVLGFRCSVFDAEDGSQWAQKSIGTPKSASSVWKRPLLEDESAELDRVAKDDSLDVSNLQDAFKRGELRTLSDADWQRMENTDSHDISSIEDARAIAETYGRDIESILQGLGDGTPMPAPVVLERADGSLTLVGGNTRLMAARALKLSPKVLWMSLRNTTVASRVSARWIRLSAPPGPKSALPTKKVQFAWFEGSSPEDVVHTLSTAKSQFSGPIWVSAHPFGWMISDSDPASTDPYSPVTTVDGGFPLQKRNFGAILSEAGKACEHEFQWEPMSSVDDFSQSSEFLDFISASGDPDEMNEYAEILGDEGFDWSSHSMSMRARDESDDGSEDSEDTAPESGEPHMSSIASRVAARYLKAQTDLVSQVGEILADEREDVKYDSEISDYCKEARKVLPKIDTILEKAFHSVFDLKSEIPAAKHPKVRQLCEEQLANILNEAATRVELVAHHAQKDVEALLAALEAGSNRTASDAYRMQIDSVAAHPKDPDTYVVTGSCDGNPMEVHVWMDPNDRDAEFDTVKGPDFYDEVDLQDQLFQAIDSSPAWKKTHAPQSAK